MSAVDISTKTSMPWQIFMKIPMAWPLFRHYEPPWHVALPMSCTYY